MAKTGGSGARVQVFQMQADALVDMSGGTPPSSGTKYEWSTDGAVANALGTLKNVRLISLAAKVVWSVQPNPLEIHVTIDGQEITFTVANPVSTTWYFAVLNGALATGGLGTTDYAPQRAFLMEGRSVKVEAETTGGTVTDLNARIKYAKIP